MNTTSLGGTLVNICHLVGETTCEGNANAARTNLGADLARVRGLAVGIQPAAP